MTTTTPRSDAAEIKVQFGMKETGTGTVLLKDMQEIERDLAAALEENAALKAELASVKAERDHLKEYADKMGRWIKAHGDSVTGEVTAELYSRYFPMEGE